MCDFHPFKEVTLVVGEQCYSHGFAKFSVTSMRKSTSSRLRNMDKLLQNFITLGVFFKQTSFNITIFSLSTLFEEIVARQLMNPLLAYEMNPDTLVLRRILAGYDFDSRSV